MSILASCSIDGGGVVDDLATPAAVRDDAYVVGALP